MLVDARFALRMPPFHLLAVLLTEDIPIPSMQGLSLITTCLEVRYWESIQSDVPSLTSIITRLTVSYSEGSMTLRRPASRRECPTSSILCPSTSDSGWYIMTCSWHNRRRLYCVSRHRSLAQDVRRDEYSAMRAGMRELDTMFEAARPRLHNKRCRLRERTGIGSSLT